MQLVAAVLFLLSASFILYVFFGYPILLGFLSKRAVRPVRRVWSPRTVSVLLPVYNGERWIRAKLESILRLDYPRELLQILVISDGSEDATDSIVEEYAAAGARLIRVPHGGKAQALNAGLAEATGEILFFTDVRQELELPSLLELVSCFADPEVGVASGELVIREGKSHEEANVGLYWRYEKWIRIRLSRIDSVLGATGAIYAMRRDLAVPLPPDTLLDDVYLPLAAFFQGYRVILDQDAKAFDYPTMLQSEFRRKIRTLAGVYQVTRAFPSLLGSGNRMWIHYVSHKLGRLMVPWALIAAAISGVLLTHPWNLLVTAGQALFYGLALLDLVIPESFPLKKVTSPVRTFVVLMAAAFCAAGFFFFGIRRLWKATEVQHG